MNASHVDGEAQGGLLGPFAYEVGMHVVLGQLDLEDFQHLLSLPADRGRGGR
jgi:hypothetical protein